MQISGQISEEFEWKRDINQGDHLSTLLYITVMNELLENINMKIHQLQPILVIGYHRLQTLKFIGIGALIFADDNITILWY